MSTTHPTTVAPAPIPPGSDAGDLHERYARLPIDAIVESGINPRRHFDAGTLEELSRSIRARGIIEPLVVRPAGAGAAGRGRPVGERFEIVAGARRHRAAKLAGLADVPALIRTYSDEAVLELTLIENIQRDGLTPLERTAAIRALMATNPQKHTIEAIATAMGMSPAWVWDHVKLYDLVPEAKALLEAERISASHAFVIARLKPADQDRVIHVRLGSYGTILGGLWQRDSAGLPWDEDDPANAKRKAGPYDGLKPVTVRELEAWIRDHVRFDIAHAAQAQPLVFADTASRVEDAVAQPGPGKKVIALTRDFHVGEDAKDPAERTYGRDSWIRADGEERSKTCEHSVLGVFVAGRGQGETLQVCVDRERCRVHFGQVIAAKEKAAKQRAAGKGTQATKTEKKAAQSWEAQQRRDRERAEQWKRALPHVHRAIVAKVKPAPLTDKVLRQVIEGMAPGAATRGLADVETLLGGKVTAKTFTKALVIVAMLDSDWNEQSLTPLAKRYKVDLKALVTQHGAAPAAPANGANAKTTASKKAAAR